jgi:nucleoside-diphosphate-sugar epimerase
VVHCAAVVGGRAKIDGAPLEVAYDFGLDSDVIQFCARTKPGRVVLFSSSAAYPAVRQSIQHVYEACEYVDEEDETSELAAKHLWLSEDEIKTTLEAGVYSNTLMVPDSVYGWCKLALEVQAKELVKLGVPTHVFRPFSGYGSDQDDGYPWPDIMKRVLAHENLSQPFEIWSSPHQVRDWIHVDDVIAQVFACVDADERGPINLCTGVPTQFQELVRRAFAACDMLSVPKIKQKKFAPSGMYYRLGDPTRINAIRPAEITVEQGIRRTFEELS